MTRSSDNIPESKDVTLAEFTTRSYAGIRTVPTTATVAPAWSPSAAVDLRRVEQPGCCAYKCCGFESSGSGIPGRTALRLLADRPKRLQCHEKVEIVRQAHPPGCRHFETRRKGHGGVPAELLG